jgi:hypothetical protein
MRLDEQVRVSVHNLFDRAAEEASGHDGILARPSETIRDSARGTVDWDAFRARRAAGNPDRLRGRV